jgi:TPP-dependent pyruvate/acetoin dehydrogenase alpha subunit
MSAAGEEATIVGLTSVMRPDDYLIGTYRAQPRGAQVGRREATLRAAPAAPPPTPSSSREKACR